MQLLVLAAGEGKRIKPIVTSKFLLPFMGQTLLERVIDSASVLKPDQITIVVNPKDKAAVAKLFPKAKVVIQEKATGMAGAVEAAGTVLAGSIVVIDGDDLIDLKIIKNFKEQINKTPNRVVLTGIKSNLTGGYFDLQGESLKVMEKPKVRPSQWAKIVLDYFPKIEDFTVKLKDDYEAGLNQLENSVLVKAEGNFYQLKFPWQILDLTAGLLTGKNLIDKTAKVMAGTEIINSYLGQGVVVGQNCLIRDSIIEAGCVIGFGTEIARSYVGPKNWFHRNYIGDSVIEGESNFGAGAVLANFRFDHKTIGGSGREKFGAVIGRGAQVGVNASVMPGAMIDSGGLVWPGTVRQ